MPKYLWFVLHLITSFLTPAKTRHHQAVLVCFLVPGSYLLFNYFCLCLARHPSFALFFISNNNSWGFFSNFGCFLFSYHFTYSDCIPKLSSLLPSNLSFIWALVLLLLASSDTFFCTVLQTPELLRSNDNTEDSQDRLWGLNKNKLNEAFKLIVINTAISGKGNSHFP